MSAKVKSSIILLLSILIFLFSFISVNSSYHSPPLTSDAELYNSGYFYTINEDNRNWCMRDSNKSREYILKYSVSQILISENTLYSITGHMIRSSELDGSNNKLLVRFNDDIKRIGISSSLIYSLVNDSIYKVTLSGEIKEVLSFDFPVINFYFESNEKIILTDKDYMLWTYDLNTGDLKEGNKESGIKEEQSEVLNMGSTMTLTQLRNKFPDGKYWNHIGSSTNNPDGYTTKACTHHNDNCEYNGSCGCNSYDKCIQCMGYAFKCGYDVIGSNPKSWNRSTSSSSIDQVKGGDIIRYRNDEHSIYVTGVVGDTIYYTDCNYGGTCKIRWDATVSKSTVKASFTEIFKSPYDVGYYHIELNANGGNCSVKSFEVVNGEKYGDLPNATREGYDFSGWYTSASGGTKITSSSVVNLNNVTKLYAHWTIKTYYVYFDGNGGTGCPDTVSKQYMEEVSLPYKKPTRNGYSFNSWNTKKDGTGERYVAPVKYTANKTVTLYAIWDGDKNTVYFMPNQGMCSVSVKTVTNGEEYGDLPTPERTGYEFLGWYTAENGGTKITSDSIVEIFSSQKLYAHWQIKTYTLHFDATGGKASFDSKQIKYYDEFGALPTASRKGYSFKGWYYNDIKMSEGLFYTWDEDISFYAVWDANEYTVTFDAQNGLCSETTRTILYDSYFSDLPIPQKDGSIFMGWFTSKTNQEKINDDDQMTYDSNITLYARWVSYRYTVILNPMGGNISEGSFTVEYDKEYGKISTPTRNGYAFTGWYTKPEGGTLITSSSKVRTAKTHELFAHWQLSETGSPSSTEYFITYHFNNQTLIQKYNKSEVITPPIIKQTDAVSTFDFVSPDYYSFVGWSSPIPAFMPARDMEVTAVFKPIEYCAHFIYNDNIYSTCNYNAETSSLDCPIPPHIYGFTGTWETFNFKPDGILINISYSPTIYTATFYDQDTVVEKVKYTAFDTFIQEPEVPTQKGYILKWSDYTIGAYDINVYASYKCISTVKINGYKQITNVNYGDTLIFSYETADLMENGTVHWFVNGADVGTGNADNKLTLSELKDNCKINCAIFDANGLLTSESNSEQIKVSRSLFNKITWWVRKVFGRNTIIEQK